MKSISLLKFTHDVKMILKREKMCVNSEYRIGDVSGIQVGKSSKIGLETTVVASERIEYNDMFKFDELVYFEVGISDSLITGNK
ncbi:hypothetical protein YC2023_043632 [Brassica napus]